MELFSLLSDYISIQEECSVRCSHCSYQLPLTDFVRIMVSLHTDHFPQPVYALSRRIEVFGNLENIIQILEQKQVTNDRVLQVKIDLYLS